MIIQIGLLALGFFILIKGADVFVESASKFAKKFKIPEIVIGLTIVAFGTSAPEAAISITGALNGSAELSVGNAIGSNIMNVLLILGIAGSISKLKLNKNTYNIEIPFVISITLILLYLGRLNNNIDRLDGLVLWALFLVFMFYLFRLVNSGQETSLDEVEELNENDTVFRLVILALIGMIAIVFGSNITIDASVTIAKELGMPERIIGLTIISFGTSLPELMTSVTAALKGKVDITIGNIIGSNIFNILFVLGTTAVIAPSPIPFASTFIFDGIVATISLMLFYAFINKKLQLRKSGAFIMLICYITYFIYII